MTSHPLRRAPVLTHPSCNDMIWLVWYLVGVQLILGLNGVIWVSAETKQMLEQANTSLISEAQPSAVRDITPAERQAIARIANCIRALAKLYFSIHPASIMSVYMVRLLKQSSCLSAYRLAYLNSPVVCLHIVWLTGHSPVLGVHATSQSHLPDSLSRKLEPVYSTLTPISCF